MENDKLVNFLVFEKSPIPVSLSSAFADLGMIITNEAPIEGPYLIYENADLSLRAKSGLSIQIDFLSPNYQRKFKPSTELLCRACGWHLGFRSVWDLTAGLGVDALMLAQADFKVLGIERNKFLVILLKHALQKFELIGDHEKQLAKQIKFIHEDSESFLISNRDIPEVIYYDPMYPAKRKTALPSKEMQVLRELNGTSGESLELLDKALSLGAKRVVVKRPHRAPPIIAKPMAEVIGKLVRYDIYR